MKTRATNTVKARSCHRKLPQLGHGVRVILKKALIGACVLFFSIGRAEAQGVPAEPTPPHFGLGGFYKVAQVLSYPNQVPEIQGVVKYGMHGKTVKINWENTTTGQFAVQEFSVAFWPTEAAVLEDRQRLCVAGTAASGATVIQIWVVPQAQFVAGSNPPKLVAGPAPIITTVYSAVNPAMKDVECALPVLGTPNAVFVQFFQSSELYKLDFTTSTYTMTKVASPSSGGGGVLNIPQLDDGYIRYWARKHIAHGYVYVFNNITDASLRPLVIRDTNLDGVLDDYVVVPLGQWNAQGYADDNNYE